MALLLTESPITEASKQDWINWSTEQLIAMQTNPDYDNEETNRVFGTDQDDIDEARKFVEVLLQTLLNNTLVPKV